VRRWRELVTSVNTYIAGASTLLLLSCSNELTAHSHAVVAFLFPMYSGMAARQPIRYTLGVSLAMLVTLPLLMWGDQPVQKLLLLQNVYLMLVAIIFTLRCSVELERNERQGYLLDCHERQQREELTAAGERLRELSMRDPLTGLSNRRQFESDLQAVWAGAIDNDRAVSLLILDVDFFKLYNDGYGHAAGDTCLKSVAAVLARIALAEGGIAARLGGEEFAVLLPGKRLPLATAAAEKIVAAVRDADIPHRLSRAAPRVTVSVGAACIYPVTDQDNRYTLLRAADVALYRAKHAGRDRVAVVDGADAVAGAYDGAPGSAPGGADVAAALNRSA
jgi:diguanylate cyclase (GGDEF)-like protein